MLVQPIPESWIRDVALILKQGNSAKIDWTMRAMQDWQAFGFEHEAYEFILKHLNQPGLIGQKINKMNDRRDSSITDCWAFVCNHPWNLPTPLYVKIGLHQQRVRINLFSLHTDDGSRKLLKAIKAYQKKHSS